MIKISLLSFKVITFQLFFMSMARRIKFDLKLVSGTVEKKKMLQTKCYKMKL